MPVYTVKDPQTGRVVKLTGDSPPTEQELIEIFNNLQAPEKAQPTKPEPSFTDKAVGIAENIGSLVSGAIAEPVAGLAGIAQAINPFSEGGAGARAVESTRESLTYKPKTETGKSQQMAIAETLKPVGEALSTAERFLGDQTLKATGSPALAAMAHTMPTAALELLGVKGAKKITSVSKPSERLINRTLIEAAPDVDQIKKASKALLDRKSVV